MPRQVIVKPLEQIDVTRMIGNASRQTLIKKRGAPLVQMKILMA